MGMLRTCLEAFGWQDYSCATLAEVSGSQLREMLRSVACRCVEKDWAEDLGSKPKTLHVEFDVGAQIWWEVLEGEREEA